MRRAPRYNTIVINGECQPPTACAVITHESLGEEISFVVMDLSAAYPSAVSALRGYELIDRRHVLIVDEIHPNGCLSSVDWQMHTAADLEPPVVIGIGPFRAQRYQLAVEVDADTPAHADNHRLTVHRREPLLEMRDQIAGDDLYAVLGADDRFKLGPFGLQFS